MDNGYIDPLQIRSVCQHCGTVYKKNSKDPAIDSHGICVPCLKKLYTHLFSPEELDTMEAVIG